MTKNHYRWAASGDVNAFFGLMLDNVADLLLTVSLLSLVFEFPTHIALRYMVPGTAIGVLVGDLFFFWMALKLAKKTGRTDVTSMPLGLDTPSTFGMVFFVLGPSFVAAKMSGLDETAAAMATWHIGICAIVASGVFKLGFAFCSNWIRRVVPRAGLLGSLAAIALVLISFLPALEIFHFPIIGFIALSIVLATLVARIRLPFRIPGALGALLVAGTVFYLMKLSDAVMGTDLLHAVSPESLDPASGLLPHEWLAVFRFEWVARFDDALAYMPIVIPFALATVVGGIDCTESAAAAGDEYDTGQVIGVEAIATLAAGVCGGVIQTTPYIGHPAYKAMGGRAAYTLATALFIGSAGLLGYFGYFYLWIPKATVFPILIFIGLEITSQSFHATPRRHFPAIVFGCIPALASMVIIFLGDLQGQYAGKVVGLDRDVARLSAIQETLTDQQSLQVHADELANQIVGGAYSVGVDSPQTIDAIEQLELSARAYLGSFQDDAIEPSERLASRDAMVLGVLAWRESLSDELQSSLPTLNELLVTDTLIRSVQAQTESVERTSGNPVKNQPAKPDGPLGTNIQTLQILAGGFVLTSLLWSSSLAMIIDRRLGIAAIYFAVGGALTLFGVIHSPLPGSAMFLPWSLESGARTIVMEYVVGYLAVASIFLALAVWLKRSNDGQEIDESKTVEEE